MKRAAVALRSLLIEDVDIEGGLLLVGLAVVPIAVGGLASNGFAGLAVFGLLCFILGVALARPRRTG